MRRGFTLLEVMVSLGILAVGLLAIGDLNGGAARMHAYATQLTVAVQLARGKMLDVEQTLHKEGLGDYTKEYKGDFSEEGWPDFKWSCKVIKPDLDLQSDKLFKQVGSSMGLNSTDMSSALGGAFGGGSSSSSSSASSALSGLAGGAGGLGSLAGAAGGLGGAAGAGGISSALGPFGGIVDAQLKQLSEQVKSYVRELKLTVSWKSGAETESFDVVKHIVVLPDTQSAGSTPTTAGGGAPGTRPPGSPPPGATPSGGMLAPPGGIPGVAPQATGTTSGTN